MPRFPKYSCNRLGALEKHDTPMWRVVMWFGDNTVRSEVECVMERMVQFYFVIEMQSQLTVAEMHGLVVVLFMCFVFFEKVSRYEIKQ